MSSLSDPSNRDERLDDLASRLLDRDIEFADVPADLRSAVQSRADEFGKLRSTLLHTDDVDGDAFDRAFARAIETPASTRLRTIVLGAAAAAITVVVALGVVATSRDDNRDGRDDFAEAPTASVAVEANPTPAAEAKSQTDLAAVPDSVLATPMQTPSVAGAVGGANSDVTMIVDMVALGAIANEWWVVPPSLSDLSASCPLAEGSQLVAGSFTFAGQPAEIHYDETGIAVFSVPECTKMASVVR